MCRRLRNRTVDTLGWLGALAIGCAAIYYGVPTLRALLWKYAP